MTRPSRNVDRILIEAGIAMVQEGAIDQLNIRELASRADVNLGMFHYHFKTKDQFLRIVLQEVYEKVFANLTRSIALETDAPAVTQLRQAFFVLGKFARDHRAFVGNLLTDLMKGSEVIVDFVRSNFPRHVSVIHKLIVQAQAEGSIVKIPAPNVLAFIIGAVAAPLFASGILATSGGESLAWLSKVLEGDVLTDKAIQKRIDMALKGVAP